MSTWALFAVLCIPMPACTPASAQSFTATAQAIDGNSLHVGTHEVRLFSLR